MREKNIFRHKMIFMNQFKIWGKTFKLRQNRRYFVYIIYLFDVIYNLFELKKINS